jgi:hypothetical protein
MYMIRCEDEKEYLNLYKKLDGRTLIDDGTKGLWLALGGIPESIGAL